MFPLSIQASSHPSPAVLIHICYILQACGAFDVWLTVSGGGLSGQAGAIRHGLAGALARYDPYLKPGLKRREWGVPHAIT